MGLKNTEIDDYVEARTEQIHAEMYVDDYACDYFEELYKQYLQGEIDEDYIRER